MEIAEIKQQLSLSQVLKHYNLKPDKNQRMSCPFHPDKTPSMQVYYKTQTAYCFSSNCKTHGKSLDVIDFIMYMEGLDTLGAEGKHKAIEKAKEISGLSVGGHEITEPGTTANNNSFNRTSFLTNLFTYFKNSVHNSKPAQEYIKQRGLDYEIPMSE